ADVAPGSYRVTAAYEDDTADIPDFVPSSATVTQQVATTPPPAVTPTQPATPARTPAPDATPAGTPPAVSRSDLSKFTGVLAHRLRLHGLAALRGRGTRFIAAAPGKLREQVLNGRTLLAAGQHAFSVAATARIPLRLTAAGKRALRSPRARRVEIRA